MKKKGLQPSSVVVDSGTMNDREVLEQLGLDGRSSCVYINRARYANNDPMVYARTYLPAKPFKELLKVDLGKHSLYKTMEEKSGVVVHRVSRRLQVGLADEELSRLLAIPEGSPIYVVYTLSYTKNGMPVEYLIAKYRGDLPTNSVLILREGKRNKKDAIGHPFAHPYERSKSSIDFEILCGIGSQPIFLNSAAMEIGI